MKGAGARRGFAVFAALALGACARGEPCTETVEIIDAADDTELGTPDEWIDRLGFPYVGEMTMNNPQLLTAAYSGAVLDATVDLVSVGEVRYVSSEVRRGRRGASEFTCRDRIEVDMSLSLDSEGEAFRESEIEGVTTIDLSGSLSDEDISTRASFWGEFDLADAEGLFSGAHLVPNSDDWEVLLSVSRVGDMDDETDSTASLSAQSVTQQQFPGFIGFATLRRPE